jgi:hypothetical protein
MRVCFKPAAGRRGASPWRFDVNSIICYTHRYRPQADARVAGVLTGLEIELIAVPGTYDVAGLTEPQTTARLIRHDDFLDAIEQLALADRTAAVGAAILASDEPSVQAENADFELTYSQHPIIAVSEFAAVSYHDLGHQRL